MVLFFIVGLAFTSYAQQLRNAHTLTVNGQSLAGNITNGSGFNYMVRTTGSGSLVVETSGNTDTYMIAYDSAFRQLATDDDGGSGANARIQLSVNANETYYFNVTGFGISTSGSFGISASMGGAATGGAATGGLIELQLDYTYSGSIQQGETQRFRVYLGTDPWYQISWDDRDREHSGELSNPADVRVGIRREDSSNFLVPISDNGNWTGTFNSYSNQHRVHSSESPRFDANTWYIIEVEATYSGGDFRLEVF